LIEFFWQTDTPYDGMLKNMVGLWMIFFAIASVLISKLKECTEPEKKGSEVNCWTIRRFDIFIMCNCLSNFWDEIVKVK